MAAQEGRAVIIGVYNGATYDTLGNSRTTDLAINDESIDITTKGSTGNWKELLAGAGTRSASISVEGVHTGGTAEVNLQAASNSQAFILLEFNTGSGEKYAGDFQITNYSRAGGQSGEETFSVTFESNGPITYTP